PWPLESATGALINYLMTTPRPVPSNINIGLFPAMNDNGKKFKDRGNKRKAIAERAAESVAIFDHTLV
ncbi:MAG: hypothetical protein HQK53_09230, partial [Oligoflexia bacterium]|nr:hypothetical protein [Oligoflexia bacterium]